MNVKVEIRTEDSWRRVLAIEIPAEEAEKEYEKVAKKIAAKVKLPGFRKGKVPVKLVRKQFKQELDQEFVESVVPKAFGEALDQTGLDPVTEPKFEELSYGEQRPLSFTADFECRPDLKVEGHKGIEIVKEIPEVTDEHVDSVLEDFRKSRAELEEVERGAIDGDVLLVDYQAVDEEGKPIPDRQVKDYVVELGAGRVVPEFEEALRGAEPDSVRTADIEYPADHPEEMLAGSTQHYKIKVRKVQEKRFPELTDELVEKSSDLKDLAELREKVKEDLHRQADRAAVERLEHLIMEKVVDANEFAAPETLVESLLEDLVHRSKHEAEHRGEDVSSVDEAGIKSQHRAGAERQVRKMLLMDAIAREEGVEVTGEELSQRVVAMAKLHGTEPKKVVEQLGGDRFLRRLSREIRDKKVLAFLVENAEITEKTVSAAPSEK